MFATYCHVRREVKLDALSAAGSNRTETRDQAMESLLDAELQLRKMGQRDRADEILATIRILQSAKNGVQAHPKNNSKIIAFPS
jgi:hypothetical protein